MARISNIMLAKSKIELYFDNNEKIIYGVKDLISIFNSNNRKWNLSYATTFQKFVDFLIEKSHLEEINLGSKILYGWKIDKYGEDIIYEIAINLKPRSYISHYSAMFLNNMTEQIPKTIYVTYDRETKLINYNKKLEQSKIDLAFSKKKEAKDVSYTFKGYRFVLINSPSSEKIGVKSIMLPTGLIIPVTNIERTLIDIIVRPELSGGIHEIIKAYKSIDTVQIAKLKTYLKKKDYVYPFEQSIGFCLEYAGIDSEKVDLFFYGCALEYNFYLDRGLEHPKFSNRWKLYYPNFL
jgi:predicted transcriptional regulator of viral defense system